MSNYPFDIFEHERILMKWITSCEEDAHIFLCRDAVDSFICERFKFSPQQGEIKAVSDRLMVALDKKNSEVGGVGLSRLD